MIAESFNESRSGIEIRPLELDSPLWGAIDRDPSYSIYHTREWMRLITEIFGLQPRYIAATVGGSLVDVLPLYQVRHPIFGVKLISTPYEGCYGGFVSGDNRVQGEIISMVKEVAKRSRARHVEIRSEDRIESLKNLGFHEQQPLLVTQAELIDEPTNWSKLSAKHRRNVRTAKKNGVAIERATNIEEMHTLFLILSRHFRQIGLPFFAWKFFENIWKNFIDSRRAYVLLAKKDGEIFGGHLLFSSGQVLISKYCAYLKTRQYSKTYASYGLFWEAIRLGIERGHTSFNMGVTGSSNKGLLDFKNRFGATTKPVYFYVLPLRGKTPDYSKYYGGYRLVKKIWSLMPLAVAIPMGHRINSWIC